MYTHHGLDHGYPRVAAPRVSYWVCATPRAGSSLVCDLLARTELAGVPLEYFDGDTLSAYWAKWRAGDFESYLRELRARKTTPNGVFGVQIHYDQLDASFSGRDLRRDFPDLRCIHVARRERVRQAVSLFRAQSTDQWAAHQRATRPAPLFNAAAIRACVEAIERQERGWRRFFAEHGIEPLELAYEDFERDHARAVVAVLDFLGVQRAADFAVAPATLARQADRWSESCVRGYELVERYGVDLAAAPPDVRAAWEDELRRMSEARAAELALSPDAHEIEGFLDEAREERGELRISGWLLLDGRPAERVELRSDDGASVIASVRVRDDLAHAFPNVPNAASAGFEARLPASFAKDGAWRFTLVASRVPDLTAHCRAAERPGGPPLPFPRALGAKETSFCARRG